MNNEMKMLKMIKLEFWSSGLVNHLLRAYSLLFVIFFLQSCSNPEVDLEEETEIVFDDTDFVAEDWTEATHSKNVDPDFAEVFDNAAVKRIDIVITEDRWSSMLSDLSSLFGSSSRPGGPISTTDNPIFVPAEVFYNGIEWYRVGVRFKGNSSLQSTYQSGNMKLSFKLDFDEFEDEYPQIDNQRFYGFKQLSLKNNYNDESFLREKAAADVFIDAGLVCSHTAFYELYVDFGSGSQYFGLYTMVEEVDDTVIETQFSSDDGNLYKPEDNSASFEYGSFDEDDFEKKTNEDEADWSDIIALFTALHDDSRTTDPASWRTGLDAVFDTDVFLKYLAVNTVIQNWDTYGRMTHNYYLYNNPDNGKLTWIPWDNNEALQEGNMGGSLNLNFSDLEANSWPLIEYLYADDVYKAKYDEYVAETADNYFEVSKMLSLYNTYSAMVEPYAIAEERGYTFLESTNDFYSAVSTLKDHVVNRNSAVANYLQ